MLRLRHENWARVSLSVCVMFILCSLQNVLQYDPYHEQELVHSTAARDAVHEGDWASYKQMPLESYCYGGFAYDTAGDFIAVPECRFLDYNENRHHNPSQLRLEHRDSNLETKFAESLRDSLNSHQMVNICSYLITILRYIAQNMGEGVFWRPFNN